MTYFGDAESRPDVYQRRVDVFRSADAVPSKFPTLVDGMGDLFATEGDCREGDMLFGQLETLMDKIKSSHPAVWSKYSTAFSTLKASHENTKGLKRWVPLHPICGEVKAIGHQAQTMAAQIYKEMGVAPAPEVKTPSTSDEIVKLLGWGVAAAVGVMVLPTVLQMFRKG